MSEQPVGGFDPQPCDTGGGPAENVNIVGPLPLPVDVDFPDPLNVLVTNQIEEPVDVNVLGTVTVTPNPLPVTGTVTANVSPNPLPVTGTVTANVSPNPLPVTGTVNAGGPAAASTTLSAATTGNGSTVDFTTARANATLFIMVNGTVTSGVVDLQASQDGTNWVRVASSAALATGVNQAITSSNAAYRWYRGVVSENVVGGGTVTATLMYT